MLLSAYIQNNPSEEVVKAIICSKFWLLKKAKHEKTIYIIRHPVDCIVGKLY